MMRKTIIISLAVFGMGMVGCSNEEECGIYPQGADEVYASVEGAGTRTAMQGNSVVWCEGDEIGIFVQSDQSNISNVKYTLNKETAGSGSGKFNGTLEGDPVKKVAFYPYSISASYSYNESKTTISSLTMKEEYTYSENSNNEAPMACLIAEEAQSSLQFKNAGALMCITVNNIPAGYNKVTLTSGGDAAPAITGKAQINFNGDVPSLTMATEATGKTITITFDATKEGAKTNKTFYFPLPVANYQALIVKLAGDGVEEKTLKNKALNAERNKRYTTTITLDEVSGEVPAEVDNIVAANTLLESVNSVSVKDVASSESKDLTITLPDATPNKSISFDQISTSQQITITSVENAQNAPEEVLVSVPDQTVNQPKMEINLPKSTVTLAANGETATYDEVTATTAENTLILSKGVTVKNLTVKGGNIRVNEGAKLTKIVNSSGKCITVYKESGAVIETLGEGEMNIVDAAVADMKKVFTEGGTYTLKQDMNIVGIKMTVPEGKEVTLDLNGKTLEAANDANITVNGTFILQDNGSNGTIKATEDWGKPYTNGIISVDGENAKMTMKGGYINAVRNDPANKGQFGITVWNGADLTIEGGRIEAGWYAVSGNGTCDTQNSIINISGGELISTADYAVYLPQSGTTTITGGTINGACGGIAINRGTLNISGEMTKILSQDEGNTGDWSDGTGNLGNAALVVAAKYDDCTVNISGGTFSSLKNAAVLDKPASGHSASISVTGGTFSDFTVMDHLADDANVTITPQKSVDLTKQIVTKGNVTLNLNDTIRLFNTNAIWSDSDWSLISVQAGTLTIKGNGTLSALKDDCYAVDVRNAATLNIEGGVYVGNIHAVYVLEGIANIKGGEYSIQQTFPGNEKPYEFVLNCLDANYKADPKKANVIVTGGTFHKFNPASNGAEGAIGSTNFCATGYTSTASDNGETWVVSASQE